jgi:hypothetical protein
MKTRAPGVWEARSAAVSKIFNCPCTKSRHWRETTTGSLRLSFPNLWVEEANAMNGAGTRHRSGR